MPAVIPAIAGFAASSFVATTAFSTFVFGSALLTGITVGAITGAVVGGLQAAITGGDIGEGLLYGSVGGAVGGALGGAFGAEWFGSSATLDSTSALSGVDTTTAWTGAGGDFMTSVGATPLSSETLSTGIGTAATTGTTSGEGLLGLGQMGEYALVQGGAQMFSSLVSSEPYATSEEGTAAKIAAEKDMTEATLAQRQREAELSATISREQITSAEKQLQENIAQRQRELMTPYEQQSLARQRSMETASGLTLLRKQQEAAQAEEEAIV